MLRKRLFVVLLAVCSVVGLSAANSLAISYPYNNITSESSAFLVIDNAVSSITFTGNTRPNSAGGGAKIRIRNSSNTVVASKIFPKQTNVDPLIYTVSVNNYRYVTVGPQFNGEWVTGVVTYTLT